MNDGGPFFPCELTFHDTVDVLIEDRNATAFGQLVKQTKIRKEQVSGVSLRDWYAGMALQGLLANPTESQEGTEFLTSYAYTIANAMLKQRAALK